MICYKLIKSNNEILHQASRTTEDTAGTLAGARIPQFTNSIRTLDPRHLATYDVVTPSRFTTRLWGLSNFCTALKIRLR